MKEIDKGTECFENLVAEIKDTTKQLCDNKEVEFALCSALAHFNGVPELTNLYFKDIESSRLLAEILIIGAGIFLNSGKNIDEIAKDLKYRRFFQRYENVVKYVKANFLELVDFGQKMEELNLEIYGAA